MEKTSKKFFLVTCAGMSASKWLAWALDLHPNIICSHSRAQFRIYNRVYKTEEMISCLCIEREPFNNETIGTFLQSEMSHGDAIAYGNVHAFRLRNLGSQHEIEKLQKKYQIANLIRHPITWLNSCAAHFKYLAEIDPVIRGVLRESYKDNISFTKNIVDCYKLDSEDMSTLAFLNGCVILEKLVEEITQYPSVQHIRMEDITTHPSLFSEFFRRFFGEEISLPSTYLDDIFSMGNINTHASEQNSGYDELFSSWPKWQQVAFSHKVSELNLIEVYKNVNYNLFTYG